MNSARASLDREEHESIDSTKDNLTIFRCPSVFCAFASNPRLQFDYVGSTTFARALPISMCFGEG